MRILAGCGQLNSVRDLVTVYELHHDQLLSGKDRIDLRNIHFFPFGEVSSEDFRVFGLLFVIHLFVDGGMKGIKRALPVHSTHEIWVSFESSSYSAQHRYIKADLVVNPGSLNLDRDYLSRLQPCSV